MRETKNNYFSHTEGNEESTVKATLSKYKISDITVSGLSAGAYMAVQMHIAYSSIINGSAIFAGVRKSSQKSLLYY